ncbi:MAG: hypothetical protein CL946_03735 [Ectothiorhodospiraceae bacterium]|nr:hypothetical protein [Ectothiorhodospiraceae bacterium]
MAANRIMYCTYIGGSLHDGLTAAYLEKSTNTIIFTGITQSSNFPVTSNAPQKRNEGGDDDSFVAKLSSDGTQLHYSTYIGGNGFDESLGLDVDSLGQAYICGYTTSTDFPIRSGAVQKTLGSQWGNCFITKLSADGSAFLESTYLGGWDGDRADDIILDGKGGLYITGRAGLGFPVTEGAFQTESFTPTWDGYIAKLSTDLSSLLYSTYIGGESTTNFSSMTKDERGNVYVIGGSASPDFPVPDHSVYKPRGGYQFDIAFAVLDSTLSRMLYGGVIGGSEWDTGGDILVDDHYNMYLSGSTYSRDLPTTFGAYQAEFGGGEYDGVLIVIPPSESLVNTAHVPQAEHFSLSQSYPNPAYQHSLVTIPFTSPKAGLVELTVYDSRGAVIHQEKGQFTSGKSDFQFSTRDLRGVYFYRVVAHGLAYTKKMIIMG